MKVLFAVNNENISESIIKRYQQDYKEIISTKNVYYFNAIIKELQRDKSYDRIVISEDVEPFSNNNYDAIDKFIFDKLDSISDEATNESGNDIPIILICADRRAKSEPLLVKLFGIGVYNALIGKDRSITSVCELLYRPRGKREAKVYYKIDSDDVDYKSENEGDVSEVEIQNILAYYKRLGRNEEKYVESFDHIASQYTDSQLKLITRFLPLNVKAVLEANSPKYQQLISFGGKITPQNNVKKTNYNDYQGNFNKANKQSKVNQINDEEPKLDIIENSINKNRISEPIIIPSGIGEVKPRRIENVNTNTIQGNSINQTHTNGNEIDNILDEMTVIPKTPIYTEEQQKKEKVDETLKEVSITQEMPAKRRGRPRKIQAAPSANIEENSLLGDETKKRGRGRPRKIEVNPNNQIERNMEQTEDEKQKEKDNVDSNVPLNLFELGDEDSQTISQVDNTTTYSDMILPGLDDDELMYQESMAQNDANGLESVFTTSEPSTPKMPDNTLNLNSGVVQENLRTEKTIVNSIPNYEPQPTKAMQNTGRYNLEDINLAGLLSRDKKVVAFVGTSKNGTSFLVNNLAEMFSEKGIKTAILDLTQNKNAYYIYTEDKDELRSIAFVAMSNLKNGNAKGIQVNKNLDVYTTLPGENDDINDYSNILETLIKNYSLVLLDCDFETNYGYFKEAQEIYLVQSLDVLTIQPLTAFLRDLKAKNVLKPERIRVVLNKVVRVRSLTERTIIGGMAYYNDPAMSFMTELFNKDTVTYCSIPFEEQSYSKYLEGLVNCQISLNGYSKNFIASLSKLAGMVYPLIGNGGYKPQTYNSYVNSNTNNNFSNKMNDTLNRMKNSY